MKTIPMIIVASIFLTSVSAHATYDTRTSSNIIPIDVAYEMDINKSISFQSTPSYELDNTVPSDNYSGPKIEDRDYVTTTEIRITYMEQQVL